jgi:hypothetical protein
LDQLPLQTLTAGLQALPNLTSLTLPSATPEKLQTTLAATCGRLTRLEMATHRERLPTLLQASGVMPKLHHLRELHIPDHIVSDDGMCALLALSSLTHVAVNSFELSSSHAHKPCSWQDLTVHDWMDVVSDLGKLPLQGLRRLVAGELVCDNVETITPHDAAVAVANIPASCHLTTTPHGQLLLDCGIQHCNQQLRLVLPFVARWEGVCWLKINVDEHDDYEGHRLLQPDTITAIASHLTHMPSCTTLELVDWIPHPACQLITALRPTHVTRLVISGYPLYEPHLLVWCCGDAGRDMTVEVGDRSGVEPEGGVQRVRAYLEQAWRYASTGSSLRVTLLGDDSSTES